MNKIESEILRIQKKGKRIESLCIELLTVLERDYKAGKLSKEDYDKKASIAQKMKANAQLMQLEDVSEIQ